MKKIEEPRIIILYNNKNKKGKEKLADGRGWGRVGNLWKDVSDVVVAAYTWTIVSTWGTQKKNGK